MATSNNFIFLTILFFINCFSCDIEPKRNHFNGDLKIDCYPDDVNVTELECLERGCLFGNSSCEDSVCGEPNCYYPSDYGYDVIFHTSTVNGQLVRLQRKNQPTMFGSDIEEVTVTITYDKTDRIRIKIFDSTEDRYEVPIEIRESAPSISTSEPQFKVTVESNPIFGILIQRKSTGAIVFDSRTPGFVFSDQFLQITTLLPTSNFYGLGEHRHENYLHNMNWTSWSLFSHDHHVATNDNLYGVQPFYIVMEEDGSASGVLLVNSNAMQYHLMPYPAVTIRSIGGILDFHIFMGPSQEDVVLQYKWAVGLPIMPPYWALGFQLSRWDYPDLDTLKTVVNRMRKQKIPYDVQYSDSQYMNNSMDFTYDHDLYSGLPDFVDQLHEYGMHYVIIVDCGIPSDSQLLGNYPPLDQGIRDDIFIKYRNGTRIVSEVWPGETYFPDFSNERAVLWWINMLKNFEYVVKYDAVWIDMNEPATFVNGSFNGCEKNKYNYPPYAAGVDGSAVDGNIFTSTLCMDTIQEAGRHYDVHSLYGHFEAIATRRALREIFSPKRSFVVSRSLYVGSGSYVNHWLGDNYSTWESMRDSIPAILEFNTFGIPFVGADICGYFLNTTEELCARWMQLGSFYPFCRNHNGGEMDQDPASLGPQVVAVSRKALLERYRLLPYLYTLLYLASINTIGTVARPLVHEFPLDVNTHNISFQFLWGKALLISPVVEQGADSVNGYFPDDTWYDYYTGMEMDGVGCYHSLYSPLYGSIPLHVRGGHILPRQLPNVTTTLSRKNPMDLLISLDSNGGAEGWLYWDDGEKSVPEEFLLIKFVMGNDTLKISLVESGFPTVFSDLYYRNLTFYGAKDRPNSVFVDGQALDPSQVLFNSTYKSLQISGLRMRLDRAHTVQLTYLSNEIRENNDLIRSNTT